MSRTTPKTSYLALRQSSARQRRAATRSASGTRRSAAANSSLVLSLIGYVPMFAPGLIQKLYVYGLDRLTRSGIRDTLEVVQELRQNGCDVVSIGDGFDLSGPDADIALAVLSCASQTERHAINERISAARERVEAEGRKWGRPSRFDAETLAKARSLREAGRSIREITIAMKVPRSTVARALAM